MRQEGRTLVDKAAWGPPASATLVTVLKTLTNLNYRGQKENIKIKNEN